jgi:hypothetical protein
MISNNVARSEIENEWKTVRLAQAMVETNTSWALSGGRPLTEDMKDLSHSLILLFAFSVLESTLKQMRAEEVFHSKSDKLNSMMSSSRSVISWVDFATINQAREKRNEIAHDAKFVTREKVERYIDSIESELLSWRIFGTKPKVRYSINLAVGRRPENSI